MIFLGFSFLIASGILSILSYVAELSHADTAVPIIEVFSSGVNPLIVCTVVLVVGLVVV